MNLEINSEQESWLENSLKFLKFGRISKQEKLRIKDSIDQLVRESISHEEVLNAEFSVIGEKNKHMFSPRSHG